MFEKLKDAVFKKLDNFLNVQTTATESYIYSSDTEVNLFNIKSVLFINKDTTKAYINNLPLDLNDSLTYNADSRSTITDNFNIVFEGGTGKLYVTIIR